jgi:pimeloyl-CoA dehydrogenase
MDIELSPEQLAFRNEVREFIRLRLPAEIRERLRKGNPPRKQDTVAWHRIRHERGWACSMRCSVHPHRCRKFST